MFTWDDVLGAQQDWLARLRYEMVKAVEGSAEFKDCKTVLDVFRRLLELEGEEVFRQRRAEYLAQSYPRLGDPDGWTSAFLAGVKAGDENGIHELFWAAERSNLVGNTRAGDVP